MSSIKVDFIHVGYHKTASSFLQLNYFNKIDNLCVLNEEIPTLQKDLWFYKNFVNVGENEFNLEKMTSQLRNAIQLSNQMNKKKTVKCISEENLSGDIYTGENALILMKRIYQIFGKTKILIVLRNQLDWLLSAYGNYVLHKGNLTLEKWLKRYGRDLLSKINYSYLLEEYAKLFGFHNINIIPYENLFEPDHGINLFLKKNFHINVDMRKIDNKLVNQGRSLLLNQSISYVNQFLPSSYYARILRYNRTNNKLENDRKFLKNILSKSKNNFIKDNEKICKLFNINLPEIYFA